MNKNIVLTGATGGIGECIARRFAAKGHTIAGVGRNLEKLQLLKNELGDRFIPFQCDLLDGIQLRETSEKILQSVPSVDCLINNAGVLKIVETHKATDSEIQEQIGIVLNATILFTKAFLPTFIQQNSGLIINMGSIAGERAAPKMAVYGAVKAAVIHWTKSIALEYADKGVRSICVNPGTVETTLMDKMMMGLIQKRVPLKRLAKPDEIAALIEYLLSPEASYITGSSITIDGGISS